MAVSHLETALSLTWSRAASWAWVRPFPSRSPLMTVPVTYGFMVFSSFCPVSYHGAGKKATYGA